MATELQQEVDNAIDRLSRSDTRDWKAQRDFLRVIRETRSRKPDLVVKSGSLLLKHNSSKLSDELWIVYEQVFVAALDTNHTDIETRCISVLEKKFGSKSVRVMRLRGLQMESKGEWPEALSLYDSILQENPHDSLTHKRRVCIHKAIGNKVKAIECLNDYIKTFSTDDSAWLELGTLYLDLHFFTQASFCYEELILAAPQNYLLFAKYAEILFSIGGQENMLLSRKYFAFSIELNPQNNIRSFYGIVMCCYEIGLSRGISKQLKEENTKILDWASDHLLRLYSSRSPRKILEVVVQRFLQNTKDRLTKPERSKIKE